MVTPAAASPESQALVHKGLAEFEARRYEDAIELFRKATRADPADRDASFYLAATYNRLGRHADAYTRLRALNQAGYRNAELDFEAGWSLMGLNQGAACINRLERYERAVPGRALTSEFLGRCLLAAGQHAEAEAKLREALRQDPSSKPRVDMLLAQVQLARGDRDGMRALFETLKRSDSPGGRALREGDAALGALATPSGTGLRLAASFSVGHNDNVIGLGNTIPLPTDISRKGADFLRLSFGASYTANLTARTTGTLGYALLLDRYDGLSASNLNDHFIYGDLFHRVSDRMGLSLRLSDEYTELGGSRFRNQVGARPALSYRFTDHSVTEFAWSYAHANYYFATAPVFDRDGPMNVISAAHYFQVPQTPWSGAIAVNYTRNRSEGSDFSFDAYGASASVRYDFTARVAGVLGAGYTRYDYNNPNSLAGAGFGFAREDEQMLYSAQLVGPITESIRWFVQGQRLRNRSNIAFYDFKQNVVSAGVAVEFR